MGIRHYSTVAFNTLQWLALDACVIHLDKPVHSDQQDRLDVFNLTQLLSNPITVEPDVVLNSTDGLSHRSHVVKLSHFSVKEYLLGTSIGLGKASFYQIDAIDSHLRIASSCMSYLYITNTYD